MRLLLLCVLLCAPLTAGEVKVGEDAPKFMAAGVKVNAYDFVKTNADCAGDVVLIMEWNCRDMGTVKALEQVNTRWGKFGGRGLWVFAVHRLKETGRQVQLFMDGRGWTFCAPLGSFHDDDNDFGKFHHDDNAWRTTVISAEGKVVFYDKSGFEAKLDAELKKLEFPGLARQQVHARANKPAKYFAEGKYGLAISEAEKVLAAKPGEEASGDLEYIIDRAEKIARRRNERIDGFVKDKRYDLALPALDRMMDDFKGHKLAVEAKEQFSAIENDKALKPEFDAFKALKLAVSDCNSQPDQKFIEVMKKFAAANPGVRAGGVATELAKAAQTDLDRRSGQ